MEKESILVKEAKKICDNKCPLSKKGCVIFNIVSEKIPKDCPLSPVAGYVR